MMMTEFGSTSGTCLIWDMSATRGSWGWNSGPASVLPEKPGTGGRNSMMASGVKLKDWWDLWLLPLQYLGPPARDQSCTKNLHF